VPNESASRLDPPALERNRRELYGSLQNKKSGKEMAKGTPRPMSDFGKLRSSSPNALKSVDKSNLRIGSARIRYQGNRRAFGLETPNQAAAAAKAKEIFLHLQANGCQQTISRYRPEIVKQEKQGVTLGEFLFEVTDAAMKVSVLLTPSSGWEEDLFT